MVRQTDRRSASRQRLLEAAAHLIVHKGTGVSLEAIGAQAGMSRSAVNYFFKSKDELLAVLASEQDGAWPEVAHTPGHDFRRWLDGWAMPLLAGRHNMRLTAMLALAGLSGHKPILRTVVAQRRRLGAEVQAALAALRAEGRVGAPASAALAELVVAGVLGLLPTTWDSGASSQGAWEAYVQLRALLSAAAGADS